MENAYKPMFIKSNQIKSNVEWIILFPNFRKYNLIIIKFKIRRRNMKNEN